MSFDLFPSFLEFYCLIYRPIIYYSSFYLVYVSSINSSRYFGLSFVLFLDLSIYFSIYLLIIGLLMYLLVHLFYVRSLSTKCFLQTFPDFTDRIFRWSFHHSEPLWFQKRICVCFFHLYIDVFVLSIACICVFIDLLVYVFSLFIHFWYIFLIYSIHFFILLFTDHLLFIYLQYLLYVSPINSSRYFGLSFVLFLDLSIYFSIYLLIIGLLMYLLVHLFYVRSLSTKFSLQTPPDLTDRIFRWSFHLLTFLFITLTLYYFSLYS